MEYRGPAVDFTVFPQPSAPFGSPALTSMPTPKTGAEDPSKTRTLRNPVVDIMMTSHNLSNSYLFLRNNLLHNNISIIAHEALPVCPLEEAMASIPDSPADMTLVLSPEELLLLPHHISVPLPNAAVTISTLWRRECFSFAPEELELMTNQQLESLLAAIADLRDPSAALSAVQDRVAGFLLLGADHPTIKACEREAALIFGHLNLALSAVSDMPIYVTAPPELGQTVDCAPPLQRALSVPTQKVLCRFLEQKMTEAHVCLAQLRKLAGELTPATQNFAPPNILSRPNPIFPECVVASIANAPTPHVVSPSPGMGMHGMNAISGINGMNGMNMAMGNERKLVLEEGDPVNTNTSYSLSFRKGDGENEFTKPQWN